MSSRFEKAVKLAREAYVRWGELREAELAARHELEAFVIAATNAGASRRELAAATGMSRQAIQNIVSREVPKG